MMDFKKEIRLAFSENKFAVYISIAILVLSLILGFYLESYLHPYMNPIVEALTKRIEDGTIQLTFQSIFSNNIRVVLMSFFFGALFCFSALILALNGFFTGYVVATKGDLVQTLILIIPHGIFEFPSCILACASGFVLFTFLKRFVKTVINDKKGSFSDRLYASYVANFDKLKQALILLMISVILMVVAGIIEVYITMPLADYILGMIS